MAADDAWRRLLAEERLGEELTPGFAREKLPPLPSLPPLREAVRPPATHGASATDASRPASSLVAEPTPLLPRMREPASLLQRSRRWLARVVVVLAIGAAAAVGWWSRGTVRHIVYIPVQVAAVPRPMVPVLTALPPTAAVPATPPDPAAASAAPRAVPAVHRPRAVTSSAAVPKAARVAAAGRPVNASQTKAPPGINRPATHRPAAVPSRAAPTLPRPVAPVAPVPAPPTYACIAGTARAARTLCDDPVLNALDRQMQALAAVVAAGPDRKAAGKAAQTGERFVRRRDKCRDDACLSRLYGDRINDLTRLMPSSTVTAALPICMPSEYRRAATHCRASRHRKIRPSFYVL